MAKATRRSVKKPDLLSSPPTRDKRAEVAVFIEQWSREFDRKLDDLDRRQDALARRLKSQAA